jgi:hypothetical protein
MREKNIPLDSYYYHEILDRLAIFTDIIDRYVYKHPVSKRHPELSDLIEEALNKLVDAYQMVANLPVLDDSNDDKFKPNYSQFEDSTFSQIPPEFSEPTSTDNLNI